MITNHVSNTVTSIKLWNEPFRIEVNEYVDRIEMIYKQTSNMQLAIYPPSPPAEQIFKIIFSCKDGVWNKSEPIYGNIISAKGESYEF
jgi:hypothetical protein